MKMREIIRQLAETIDADSIKDLNDQDFTLDNYVNISENDDCIIDLRNDYNRLRKEFTELKKNRRIKI